MIRTHRGWLAWVSIGVAMVVWMVSPRTAEATNGAAATVHPRATEAALRALQAGGNAIDAAIAAALTLGVVDGENSGIGGGCLALVRLANGRLLAIDGREEAPGGATRTMFLRDGRAVPELSLVGSLASGVPGELAALDLLARRYARLPLAHHLREAALVAEEGFVITRYYAGRLRQEADIVRRFPSTAAIFLRPDGSPWGEGETLRQPDLAATYRAAADQGARWFYRGPFAERTEAWMRENGGVLSHRDFARYRVRLREPVVTTYRGFTIAGFPPPSSGGVHVAQILNIVEHFDLGILGASSAESVHVLAESMKAAFADRAFWLGDPDFARVPRGLVAKSYAAQLAAGIRIDAIHEVTGHGIPPGAGRDAFGKHTTHLSTMDTDGNWVALTATVNTTLGSKVVVPGTGVVLNNQMDDFAVEPGATNFFGLGGAEANAVAPGKRPLSSMSPTLVLRDGRPVMALGAAGGPTIISQTVLAIVRVVDFGASVAEAIGAPRLHHQWRPDELVLEEGWNDAVVQGLKSRGHHVRIVSGLGATQAVAMSGDTVTAVADPRVDGSGLVTAVEDVEKDRRKRLIGRAQQESDIDIRQHGP